VLPLSQIARRDLNASLVRRTRVVFCPLSEFRKVDLIIPCGVLRRASVLLAHFDVIEIVSARVELIGLGFSWPIPERCR
jgi:hypothetical protein